MILPPARNLEDYASMLSELMPKGPAWTRSLFSNFQKLWRACGTELARAHALAETLLKETTPSEIMDSLEDWEEELGLPEIGTPEGITEDARKKEVVRKFRALGGCSSGYLVQMATILGYTVTISEYYPGAHPFKAGVSRAGDPLTQGKYLFSFLVTVHGVVVPALYLESMIRAVKPAHTNVAFAYSET